MAFLYGALMFIALIGMMVCSKKQKTNPAMQPVAFILLVVVIVSGVFLMKNLGVFGEDTASLMESENHFRASTGFAAGQHLAKDFAGKKVLIVTAPKAAGATVDYDKPVIDAFKESYGSDGITVTAVEVESGKADEGMPLEMLVTAKEMNAVIDANADAEVVVFMLPLPQDATAMKLWKMDAEKRPKVFLMASNPIQGIDTLVKSDVISGIIIGKPKMKIEDYDIPAPSDFKEAFDIRYIIVDKTNVDANKSYISGS